MKRTLSRLTLKICDPRFAFLLLLLSFPSFPICADQQSQAQKVQACMLQLDNPDANVRKKAAAELRSLGADAAPATWPLMQHLMDPDNNVRKEAYATLSRLAKEPATLGTLSQGLNQPDKEVRLRSLDLLAQAGPSAVPFLSQGMADRDAQVGQHAAVLLAQMAKNNPQAAQALMAGTTNMDPNVRQAAQAGIKRLPPSNTPGTLADAKGRLSSSNPLVRMQTIQQLEAMGPKALQASPWLKQVWNGTGYSDPLHQEANKALKIILQPTEDTDFFFYLDKRLDWCKQNLVGHVKELLQTNEDDQSSMEEHFDKNGYLIEQDFANRDGYVVKQVNYTRDAYGNIIHSTVLDGVGTLLLDSVSSYDPLNRKIKEVLKQDVNPVPVFERNYSYDQAGNLVHFESFHGMRLEPLTIDFKYNKQNQLVERRVSRGRLLPQELTQFAWDANGNTQTRWEFYDNLPLVEKNSFLVDFTGKYSPRRVLRYFWAYNFSPDGEKLEQDLFWDDHMLAEKSTFEWDEYKNISRELKTDEDGHLLEDKKFTWDQYQNLSNRYYYSYQSGNSVVQVRQFEYDPIGNWTRLSGNLPYFMSGPTFDIPATFTAQIIAKGTTFNREFKYWDKVKDLNCQQGVNLNLPPLP